MGKLKSVDVTLYYATWCGHCVNMKPEWNRFKENIEGIENTHNSIKIKIEEHEHSELEKKGGGKINGKDIQGYPTIKIKLTCGKEKKEYDFDKYGKERGSDYMTNFIKNVCNGLAKY
jgi:hypothetical protein